MNRKSTDPLRAISPFDWGAVMTLHQQNYGKGNQVFHFNTKDKPSSLNPEAVEFIARYLGKATRLKSDAEVLRFGSDQVTLDGAYIELGVATGRTINFLAGLNPTRIIYGFDSFEGLPQHWDRPDAIIPKGTFAFTNKSFIPPVLENAVLFKGNFDEVLPVFKSEILKEKPIAFMHIDCDIYESTKGAFRALQENIVPGTVMVFDELYNYVNYQNHEWKALQELLIEKHFIAEFLAYNGEHEQVALRISDVI